MLVYVRNEESKVTLPKGWKLQPTKRFLPFTEKQFNKLHNNEVRYDNRVTGL